MTPTAEQLDHLIGHTDHRPLTPDEHAALRAGVQQLRASLAGTGAALRRAPSGAYHQQVVQQLRAAEDELAKWRHKTFAEGMLRRRAEAAERRLAYTHAAWQSTIVEARRQAARADTAAEDDEMVLVASIPIRPPLAMKRRPVFTGCLAYLAEEER